MSQQPPAPLTPRRSHSLLQRVKNITVAVVLAAAMAMLTSLAPAPARGPSPLQAPPPPVSAFPPLLPAFDRNIPDYVVRGVPGSPVQLTINAPDRSWVSVDNQPFRAGAFTTSVNVGPSQSFEIAIKQYGVPGKRTYHVRCLPPDFPLYAAQHLGQTQAEWYIVVPDSFSTTRQNYVILFDTNGVPVWWYNDPAAPLFGTFLRGGTVAWNNYAGESVVRAFDGTLQEKVIPPNPPGGYLDLHELLQLPNGNYVFIVDVTRGPVDLSAYGGSSTANVTDCVIEEVTPSGALVWRWSTMDHVSAAETVAHWRNPYFAVSPADPYHMNSVEPDNTGTGYVVSCRHMDAVFYIDRATGNILWKLGGTPTAQSLKFVGDPYGNFGGQHDARVRRTSCALPGPPGNGNRAHQLAVTIHDDGTNQGRPPRAVRYLIDEVKRTATLIESVSDPDVTGSGCCGSARRLETGNWVMSWGGTSHVGEYDARQQKVFQLDFPNQFFSYRAIPVVPGQISREDLRDGMDAQFPR